MSKSKKAAPKQEKKVVAAAAEKETNSVSKSALIEAIAEKSGLTKAAAGKALEATLESISEALVAGKSITLIGFGTFGVKTRAARKGFNPLTKEPMDIAEARVASFKAGKKLKEAVDA